MQEVLDTKTSKKILELARDQQNEIEEDDWEDEEEEEEAKPESLNG